MPGMFWTIRAAEAGSHEVRSAEKPDGGLILGDLVRFPEIEWSR